MFSKCTMLLFVFCLFFDFTFAQDNPKQEVAKLVTNWHTGLQKADLEGLMAQYASDAVFFPTFINAAVTAEERKIFLQTLIAKKPVATMNNDQRIRLFADVATCSGTWVFEVNNAEGNREKKPVRYLFVFEKRAGKYLIVEQHVSGFPVK